MVAHGMSVELPGDSASIARARRVARRLARACGANADDLALAASEAVTNALVHGYREDRTGAI